MVTFAAYAGLAQNGRHVTITNASFNGNVPAGRSVQILIGIHANPTGTNAPPASFQVNGRTCGYTPQPYLVAAPFRPAVPEGGTGAFTVALSQAPASNITVRVGGGGAGSVISAAPVLLTYTPDNWNAPQTVTLTSIEDADTTDRDAYFP